MSGDGCSSTCGKESGWTCTGGNSSSKDICSDTCGDGRIVVRTTNYCDDGNNSSGDGCSSTCGIEAGWTCTGGTSLLKDTCKDICGDGKVMSPSATY